MEGKEVEGWEFMRIKGIPLRVHPSWFAILLLFTWSAQTQITNVSESALPFWLSWTLALITSLLLFLSVLLHELGHSFVALREGVKVRSITLFLLGGVARVERECSTAMGSLRVAMAGPVVSFILAIILLRGVQSASEINPLLANLMGQLGSLNLVLALFNLLPGLPLDGGLILKAVVWQLTGSQKKGIQVANSTGRFLSLLGIFIGVWFCLKSGSLGGLWLVLIGWFGLSASRSQSQIISLQKVLTDLKVADASRRNFRVLEENQPLTKLSQLRSTLGVKATPYEWVMVCRDGRWVGYITDQVLKDIPVQNWNRKRLLDFKKPISDLCSINSNEPLWKAVLALENSNNGKLLVLNPAGLPSGTLDKCDIGFSVLKRLGMRLPDSLIVNARNKNIYPLNMNIPQIVDIMISTGMIDNLADQD